MSNVFISYSRKNKDCVYDVVAQMERYDFDCWIDKKSIELSSTWLDEIESAINEASVFVLFWSKEAADAAFVTKERELAQSRVSDKSLEVLTIMLDDTDLPSEFEHLQAYDMQGGCESIDISSFIKSLDDSWRSFSTSKKLKDQPHRPVAETPFISVPFAVSPHKQCRAYIVGNPDATFSDYPLELIVALQFTQPKNNNMIASIHKTFDDPGAWFLHITGPDSPKFKNGYGMDDNDPDQWIESVTFINDCIVDCAASASTTLKFFTLTPVALFGAVCTEYGRFWASEYFNWSGDSENPYISVLKLERNR